MMPPDPPLKISVISYTFIEALATEIDKAIPFRGFLNAWAYLGHSVIVFEGHPSAFESGVRDCDVLFVDSGMMAQHGCGGCCLMRNNRAYSCLFVTGSLKSTKMPPPGAG